MLTRVRRPRRALGDLASRDPTARALTNMAAIERGEGAEDHVVRAWLARALTARRGPQWVCESCQNVSGEWAPVCPNCGGFDTLAWREPPGGQAQLPAGLETLPLLVGRDGRGANTVEATAAAGSADPGVVRPDAPVDPVPATEIIDDRAGADRRD